jgi:hypothetical protein
MLAFHLMFAPGIRALKARHCQKSIVQDVTDPFKPRVDPLIWCQFHSLPL